MIFADGSQIRSDYTNSVLNPRLDKQLFNWQPPAEFKVVEPLSP
jgi:hypothetical protein